MPEYQSLEPIDPREAFGVTPGPEAVETRSTAASQAALLLAARAGVLGQEDEIEELEREVADEPNFDLPELRPLERAHRIPVAEATRPLSMSQTELRTESAPAVQEQMARTVDDLYRSPSFEDAAALFEAGMQSPHPLVRVAAAAGARETTRLRPQIRLILEEGAVDEDPLVSRSRPRSTAPDRSEGPQGPGGSQTSAGVEKAGPQVEDRSAHPRHLGQRTALVPASG